MICKFLKVKNTLHQSNTQPIYSLFPISSIYILHQITHFVQWSPKFNYPKKLKLFAFTNLQILTWEIPYLQIIPHPNKFKIT